MMRTSLARAAFAAVLATLSTAALRAQCDLEWVASGGYNGASGIVRAMTRWDPDGAGPLPEQLVIGGDFGFVSSTISPLVAMVDPQTGEWQPLGVGIAGYRVAELAVLANGDLIASGNFSLAGGAAALDVARWNGNGWTSLGLGNAADALLAMPNGILLAASNTLPGSQWVGKIRRWNGISWTQLGTDIDGRIEALAMLPNGDIVAGGQFTSAGGVAVDNLARWNGTTWSSLGDANSAVLTLTVEPGGDLLAGGYFTTIGGQLANRIARWDGVAWSALGSGVTAPQWGSAWSIAALGNGDVIAGGYFVDAGGLPASHVARWSNGAWSSLGTGIDGQVLAVTELANGDVVVGGAFQNASGVTAHRLAQWNGAAWSAFGTPSISDGQIPVSTVAANGDLIVGGDFTTIGGVAASRVARRTSTGWVPLGGGVSGTGGSVRAIVELPNGDVVVGGTITSAGGVPVDNIAIWNGSTWSSPGGGTNGGVATLRAMPDGSLVAGGWFTAAGGTTAHYLARWDGTTWSPFGGGPTEPVVNTALRSNGDLLVSTAINPFLAKIERWDGSAWSIVVSMQTSAVSAMLTLPNDDVVIAGFLPGLGIPGLARWDGAAWHDLGLTFGSQGGRLALAPTGELIASGNIVTSNMTATLARWDGANWTALDNTPGAMASTLAMLPHGELVIGGASENLAGIVSPYLISLVAPCPATAVPFGAGCVGSVGTNELVVDTLPWLGGKWRSRATGMPAQSLVATVTGFTPLALPLNVLWPQAGAGCLGYTTAENIDLALPIAGEVTSSIAVPSNPVLIGAQLHQYALAFEFDALGALLAVTSTNGVTVTLGRF